MIEINYDPSEVERIKALYESGEGLHDPSQMYAHLLILQMTAESTIIVSAGGTYTKVSRESGKWAASQPVAAAVVRCLAALAETRNDPALERIATLAYAELKAVTVAADQADAASRRSAEETTEGENRS